MLRYFTLISKSQNLPGSTICPTGSYATKAEFTTILLVEI